MKEIKTRRDLAINGAPAAFKQALHIGRPNVGSRKEFFKYAEEIFDRNWLSNNGPVVEELEKKIAEYHKVKHCIAICNGTVALEIAIRSLGLKGEVIVPSYTFIATAHALSWQGITPVFADIDPDSHNLDPESVRNKITSNTTAILGVHLWGRVAPVEELRQIAKQYNLKLLFDAAHAFGCSHNSTMVGNFGDCEVFSFHATKFFNTFEGGAVLTNDDQLAEKVRLMRNFGFEGMDNVVHLGINGKMTEISAAMGLVNINSIKDVINTNQQNYFAYKKEIDKIKNITLFQINQKESNNYQYIVLELNGNLVSKRDEIIRVLHAENVKARRYFWPGCHRMQPYREQNQAGKEHLINTEKVAERVIVLPTGKAVSVNDIEIITDIIRVGKKGAA